MCCIIINRNMTWWLLETALVQQATSQPVPYNKIN